MSSSRIHVVVLGSVLRLGALLTGCGEGQANTPQPVQAVAAHEPASGPLRADPLPAAAASALPRLRARVDLRVESTQESDPGGALRAAMKARSGMVRSCYERVYRDRPQSAPTGDMVLRAHTDPAGVVTLSVERETPGADDLIACVREAMHHMRLKATTGIGDAALVRVFFEARLEPREQSFDKGRVVLE
jgi:hypothetical protein